MSGKGKLDSRPRLTTLPLPPYSYVPGHAPHPVSDPLGHMYGHVPEAVAPLDPRNWRASEAYRFAIDLFNHGYYWEAHEAWESLWHAAGRAGVVAIWCKTLIKLAAAGVKAREGNPTGVERHARRALELLGEARELLPPDAECYCGIELAYIARIAKELADGARDFNLPQPKLLLPQWLPTADC